MARKGARDAKEKKERKVFLSGLGGLVRDYFLMNRVDRSEINGTQRRKENI
jgi:hypothetical protein